MAMAMVKALGWVLWKTVSDHTKDAILEADGNVLCSESIHECAEHFIQGLICADHSCLLPIKNELLISKGALIPDQSAAFYQSWNNTNDTLPRGECQDQVDSCPGITSVSGYHPIAGLNNGNADGWWDEGSEEQGMQTPDLDLSKMSKIGEAI